MSNVKVINSTSYYKGVRIIESNWNLTTPVIEYRKPVLLHHCSEKLLIQLEETRVDDYGKWWEQWYTRKFYHEFSLDKFESDIDGIALPLPYEIKLMSKDMSIEYTELNQLKQLKKYQPILFKEITKELYWFIVRREA